MNSPFASLIPFAAIIIGAGIGYLFGAIQNSALLKNKKLNENGKLKSGWFVMPGSFSRIAILLIVLALIQAGLPVFFQGNIQWLVSAGLVLGYGWTMVKRLRERTKFNA